MGHLSEGSVSPFPSEAVSLLTFSIGGRLFAAEIGEIKEVIGYRKPAPTPKAPPFVEGMIIHKRCVVPVVSLRQRLGVTKGLPGVILLFSYEEKTVGLSVDGAYKVISVDPHSLLTPPPKLFGIRSDFIKGVTNFGGRALIWLNNQKLLSSKEEITLVV